MQSNAYAFPPESREPFRSFRLDDKPTSDGIQDSDGDFACFFSSPLQYSLHSVKARRKIFHEHDRPDTVPILSDGWAITQAAMPDGRRQILSFILPGDMLSVTSLVGAAPHYVVEAVTDVCYRAYNRDDVKRTLVNNPDMLDKLLELWVKRKLRGDQLIIDLGRRTAAERIARLILCLMNRLNALGQMNGLTMEFPLRQHHIADATGLTPPHVSNVLTELRQRKLIAIAGRSLTILDLPALRRVALSK